jgi:hypothetical protein
VPVDTPSLIVTVMQVMYTQVGPVGPTGDTGPAGPTGATGSAATIAAGTTTTLSPGASATVANAGTSSAAVFNFGIPAGVKGDKGDTGDAGDDSTITVGTTTTLSAGASATVANSGTASAAILDFGIPQGLKGDTGDPGLPLEVLVLSDFVSPYSYIGVALAGSATSSPVWKVSRINVGPPVATQVADPIEWDDRLTAVYT